MEQFTVSVEANPVRIWLRTECPPTIDPLGEAVEVRLRHNSSCGAPDEGAGTSVYPPNSDDWVSLTELRNGLRNGVRLDRLGDDEPCLDSDVCLDLEYRVPADATWTQDLRTELTFELAAEQCRHVPEDEVDSPFPHLAPCPEPDCPDCVELGKIEVENDRLDPGTYSFDELYVDDETTYAVEVLRVTNKADSDGEQETVCAGFRLLVGESEDDLDERNAPPICHVDIAGGQSDSSTRGPHVEPYDIEPPTTRTRGQLCTGDPDDPDASPGELPAISHLVVSVCSDGDVGSDGDGGDDACVTCPSDDGDRVDEATFRYEGPDGVTVTVDQRDSGETDGGQVFSTTVDDGDSFTVDFAGSESPDFAVDVDGTPLSVPVQDDTSTLHISCSDVFGPGLELVGDGDAHRLTVESAVNKSGADICEVST